MRHIPEELLVDYALGNLSVEMMESINHHLNYCPYCTEELKSWKKLLNNNEEITPSETLNNRILNSSNPNPINEQKRRNRKIIYAAISAAAFLFICLSLFQINQQQPVAELSENEYITARHDLIPEQHFMNNPSTNRLDVVPVTMDRNIKGDVWLNEVTNELYLQVEGLKPLDSQDYQVWLVRDDNGWKDELLRLQDGRVHVYYKGPNVKTIRFIKVSVEPIGGSQLPTGPETLFIDLQQ